MNSPTPSDLRAGAARVIGLRGSIANEAVRLAEHYLATIRPDDGEPITPEWIEANTPPGVTVFSSPRLSAFIGHGATDMIYTGPVYDRGHFRSILQALRIPVNEVPDAE